MVAFSWDQSLRSQNGNGIIDSVLSKFTAPPRYTGERHAISLANDTFGTSMNWMGPGTSTKDRTNTDLTPKQNSLPIRNSDLASYEHDISYYKAKQDCDANPTSENRNVQLNRVWRADEKFINDMKQDPNEPMAAVASKLISSKRALKRSHLLPTKVFEGFGESGNASARNDENLDPALRLREIVQAKYKNELKHDHRIINHKRNQIGGMLPIFIPIIASVIGSLAGKVYDTIKEKIQGKGYELPKLKTKEEKHDYVLKLLKMI